MTTGPPFGRPAAGVEAATSGPRGGPVTLRRPGRRQQGPHAVREGRSRGVALAPCEVGHLTPSIGTDLTGRLAHLARGTDPPEPSPGAVRSTALEVEARQYGVTRPDLEAGDEQVSTAGRGGLPSDGPGQAPVGAGRRQVPPAWRAGGAANTGIPA